MILGLNHGDGNYFGKAIKIKNIGYIGEFIPYDESFIRVAKTKNIDDYIKENKLIIY